MNEDLVKKLKDNPYFIEFQKFAISKIDELNSIGDLKDLTNKKAGETVRARAIASSVLQEILKPFINFSEKRKPTAKEVDVAKTRVGL